MNTIKKGFKYADRLPNSLFKKNRERFLSLFKEKVQDRTNTLALFKGIEEIPIYNSDISYPSYQEGFFYYLFGVVEEGCYGAINLETG